MLSQLPILLAQNDPGWGIGVIIAIIVALLFAALVAFVALVYGNLWVQDFRPPSQEGPDMWTIFGPDGQALGRFETPENLTIYEIGADYVLGRTTDQLDVERVVLLSLERKAP